MFPSWVHMFLSWVHMFLSWVHMFPTWKQNFPNCRKTFSKGTQNIFQGYAEKTVKSLLFSGMMTIRGLGSLIFI